VFHIREQIYLEYIRNKNIFLIFRFVFKKYIYLQPIKQEIYVKLFKKYIMTKAEIVADIANKTGIEKVAVQASVEAFMEAVKGSLNNGENVYLRGFGSFTVKKRAQKTGRNISKNTTIIIPEHFIPSFKPAKTFVNDVKNNVK
jgi:DNA-binding protein HU-beta